MNPNITLVSSLNNEQVNALVELYSNEFWCNRRSHPDVDTMLINTDIIVGAIDEAGKLVGYILVLTDFVYKATTIYDLIVRPDYRNNNLGRELMNAIIDQPELTEVEHFDLHCLPEMIHLYEKWNFTQSLDGFCFMRRSHHNDDIKSYD